MLVIISDLHLTDGSSGETISSSAFKLFKHRLNDMAYDASWRDDENYKPIEQLDIILLGDILDMIRSERWNKALETIMPWTAERQDDFYNNIATIVDSILAENEVSFSILKSMSEDGIEIPLTMQIIPQEEKVAKKKNYASSGHFSVKVNLYYMIGNHDWFFYIDDPRMNVIRNKVIDALGLSNDRDAPFPHSPHEKTATVIQKIQGSHRVYAKHGDEFDKTNFQTPHRDASSVGDVVVIKLLNEIPKKIEESLEKQKAITDNKDEIKNFIKALREIDNLRPYSLAPAWILQVLKDTKLDDKIVNESIAAALRSVMKDFRTNTIISKNLKLFYGMKVAELLLSGNFSLKGLSNLINAFGISKDKFESYRQYAVRMSGDRECDFFVMGHTHYPEVVPLSTYIDGYGVKRNKIYINTGTWRSLHKTGIEDKSFISFKTITLAGFFKEDERKGRPFEFWTGSLAL